MALITCEECGREISDKAGSCPHCGYPVIIAKQHDEKPKPSISEETKLYGTTRCRNCNFTVPNNSRFCPECGCSLDETNSNIFKDSDTINELKYAFGYTHKEQTEEKVYQEDEKNKTYGTHRLVIGIISCVLFFVISFQSCAAGIANAFYSNNSISGIAGIVLAFCMLIAGIVSISLHKKESNPAYNVPAGFYVAGAYIGSIINIGVFSDLTIWVFISALFGALHIYYYHTYNGKNRIIRYVIPIAIVVFASGISLSEKDKVTNEVVVENTNIETKIVESNNVKDILQEPFELSAGMYIIGDEIEGGKYDIVALEGSGYVLVYNDYDTYKEDGFYKNYLILGAKEDIIEGFESLYSQEASNIRLEKDQCLIIETGLKVQMIEK